MRLEIMKFAKKSSLKCFFKVPLRYPDVSGIKPCDREVQIHFVSQLGRSCSVLVLLKHVF